MSRINCKRIIFSPTAIGLAVAFVSSDPVVAATADAPTYEGPHIEVRGGYDHFTSDFDDSADAAYGIGIGYDVPLDHFIIGIGAGVDFSGNDVVEVKDFRSARHYEFEVAPKRDIEVTARIGMKVWNTLAYVRAGYSNARFTLDHPESTAPFAGSRNFDGLRAGGGLEWQVSGHLHSMAEYRFTDYELNLKRHQVIWALAYRF